MGPVPDHLRGWILSDTFTIKQAACLWVGVDPHDAEPGTGFWPVARALATAIEAKKLPAEVHQEQAEFPDSDTGETITLSGPSWDKTTIARDDLAAWAQGQELPSVFPFGRTVPEPQGSARHTLESRLGSFWTRNLDHLCAAVEAHYKDAPKGGPYPTSDTIIQWLTEERKLDRNPAEAIDKILRPDDHPRLKKS